MGILVLSVQVCLVCQCKIKGHDESRSDFLEGLRNSSGQAQSCIQKEKKNIEGYGLQQQLSLVQSSSLSIQIRIRKFKNSGLWVSISILLLSNPHNFELEKKIWKGVIWLQKYCQRMSFLKHGSGNKISRDRIYTKHARKSKKIQGQRDSPI